MSTINTAGTSSSTLTFDPNIATQCLKKHHDSLQNVGPGIRLQIKVTKNGEDALSALDALFEDWTDTRRTLPTRKGKRQIPSVGPGSHKWTLTKHDEFRAKTEQLETALTDMTSNALKTLSRPRWTGCKCKSIETEAFSVETSQQPSTSAPTAHVKPEEAPGNESEEVPSDWDDDFD